MFKSLIASEAGSVKEPHPRPAGSQPRRQRVLGEPKPSSDGTQPRGRPLKLPVTHGWEKQMAKGAHGKWAVEADDASSGEIVYRWNKTFWSSISSEAGKAIVAGWLKIAHPYDCTPNVVNQCWQWGVMRLRLTSALPKLQGRRAVIPCQDAYLEITESGVEVMAPDPFLGMTYAVQVTTGHKPGRKYKMSPIKPGGLFESYLNNALPDLATRALAQELAGMTLLPGSFQIAGWFHGAAGSGKSALQELIEAMHARACRLSLDSLSKEFALEPLIGASVVLADEVADKPWDEARFKTLTAGNGVDINRKNQPILQSYHSTAKWIITSNNPPFVRDKSDGVWRRLCPIYFANTLPMEQRITDFHLEILKHEGKEVLDWMLEGAMRIVNRGWRFMPESQWPQAVVSNRDAIRLGTDSIRAWVQSEKVHVGGEFRPKSEVYERYLDWCHAECIENPVSNDGFWRLMKTRYLQDVPTRNLRAAQGKQIRMVQVAWQDVVSHDPLDMLDGPRSLKTWDTDDVDRIPMLQPVKH